MSRYRRLYRIGSGGMGHVYRATRTLCNGDESPVACKVILPSLASDDEYVRMFCREAKVTMGLGHPHVVRVYDCLRGIDGRLYLIMELVEGVSLAQLVCSAGRLPADIVRRIAADLFGALVYVHERNVVHRDISPENVLISRAGEVKLTDFGLAKDLTIDAIQSNGTPGRLSYMAPELADGRVIDERVDVFACATTLYYLIAGEPPFGRDWNTIMQRRHTWQLPDLPDDAPTDLRDLVMGILRRVPDDRRPQTAREALDMLRVREERSTVLTKLGRMVETVYAPLRTRWEADAPSGESVDIEAQSVIEVSDTVPRTPPHQESERKDIEDTRRARSGVWAFLRGHETSSVRTWRPWLALAAVAAVLAALLAWNARSRNRDAEAPMSARSPPVDGPQRLRATPEPADVSKAEAVTAEAPARNIAEAPALDTAEAPARDTAEAGMARARTRDKRRRGARTRRLERRGRFTIERFTGYDQQPP